MTSNNNELKAISESVHQFRVVQWLEANRIAYFKIPNENKMLSLLSQQRKMLYFKKMKQEGYKPGLPDIMIITPCRTGKPVVLEMKKYMGEKHKIPCNCMNENQKQWQRFFTNNGWIHILAHGADDAIDALNKIY